MIDFIPIVAIFWFLYFLRSNKINNPLVGLLFLSYFFFATNYSNFGHDLNFEVFRSLHRIIGISCILVFLIFPPFLICGNGIFPVVDRPVPLIVPKSLGIRHPIYFFSSHGP